MRESLSFLAGLSISSTLLAVAWAQTGAEWTIDTIAGGGSVRDGGPAIKAQLFRPEGVALDSAGNLYIADTANHRIRRVDVDGTITTFAGTGDAGFSGDGGPAVEAQLFEPGGMALDDAGNLYIADSRNHRVRRVDANGTMITLAGTGVYGYGGDGGPAIKAQLFRPEGVALDGAGNLYIADTVNHRIRRVDSKGTITTMAGSGGVAFDGGGYSGDSGPAIEAQLSWPADVTVDGAGNLYIADTANRRIRRVDANGTITTIAGTGFMGYSGDGGPAIEAEFSRPRAVASDNSGNLYIADTANHRIRRVDAMGVIATIAGTGRRGYSGEGGPAVEADLSWPEGLTLDSTGNLYIADSGNHRVRRVDGTRTINTVAGTGEVGYIGDGGLGVEAQLVQPEDVAVDEAGNLYIADRSSHRIRRVDSAGTITTVAGTGRAGYSGDGGPAVDAQLSLPKGVAVDASGNLYIADSFYHRIRRVDSAGTITTIAGTGRAGYSGDGGPAIEAQLRSPYGMAVDGAGNLYIADRDNHRIRRVDATGIITTIAGTGERGLLFLGDGGPAVEAPLSWPEGVAVDGSGNLYIADTVNHRIRRVDATGIITTVAATGKSGYSGDGGPAVEAQLFGPKDVAVDGSGNLYISDTINHRIRRVDATGIITTIAGTAETGYSGDGGSAAEAQLFDPIGIALDAAGNLYVADSGNRRIRKVSPTQSITLQSPTGLTATAVSPSRIDLIWQDNSANETGFKVQRRQEGPGKWVEAGTTTANVTTFSDGELLPATVYHFRVQAFNQTTSSAYSNEAMATTSPALPPTLTRFNPSSGPVGTRVTLIGTHFLGATDVRFNGVSSLEFEVLSTTSIRTVVPSGATSGPISVVTPGGTAVSSDSFTVTEGGNGNRLFVPVLLTSAGRNNAFFTSELTLTNRGTEEATLHYTYTADAGGGSGAATDTLAPGRQTIKPDAIDYLTGLGIPIPPSGNRIGTLRVAVSGSSEVSVVTRTTTAVPDGRAGLAYPAIPEAAGFQQPVYLCGLRQNTQDRSNLALQNMGAPGDGPITLRTTLFSGEADDITSRLVGEETLPPGGFHQYSGLLGRLGTPSQGYVKVEKIEGDAPFYAYGVINDNFNSDGSFVFPVTESSLVGTRGQTLPVIIETGSFQSELTVTNFSAAEKTVDFSFVADAVATGNDTATFSLALKAGEQRILPDIVEDLRGKEVDGIGPAGRAFVGALFAAPQEGDLSGIVIGARTGSPDGRGGQYSLFYNGVAYGAASVESAWVYGLQQNAENRSNLALVNTGEIDDSSITLEITIHDGSGESQPRTESVTLGPRRWTQENGILGGFSQGYVQVRKTAGNNPFVTYGVVNDGGRPGERSGDGAFLLSQE